jgi:hypothetical protein
MGISIPEILRAQRRRPFVVMMTAVVDMITTSIIDDRDQDHLHGAFDCAV